jgi:hypothetical protein
VQQPAVPVVQPLWDAQPAALQPSTFVTSYQPLPASCTRYIMLLVRTLLCNSVTWCRLLLTSTGSPSRVSSCT